MAESHYTCETCGNRIDRIEFQSSGVRRKDCPACRPARNSVVRRAHVEKPCAVCGVLMSGPPKRMAVRVVCSVRCQHAKFSKDGNAPYESHCLICGTEILATRSRHSRNGRKIYCSNECKFKAQVVDKSWIDEAIEYAKPHCAKCGKTVPRLGMRFCSRVCARDQPTHHQCIHCGVWYQGFRGCSTDCCASVSCVEAHRKIRRRKAKLKRKGTAAYRAAKSKQKAVRRARARARSEPVDPLAVFERDGWRCQICGCKTPKRLRGTIDPRAPELDHIHSLALGGSHTWSNLQCACRACNVEKGARSLGQLNFPFLLAQ